MKIINDTLKGPNGKYSRKSLTMFVSFIACVILGSYIVFSNYLTTTPINTNAIDVFEGFLILVGALSGISVWDKQVLFSKKKVNEENNEEE